jgi:hypothetical protein
MHVPVRQQRDDAPSVQRHGLDRLIYQAVEAEAVAEPEPLAQKRYHP